ncbi:outer membrane protein assembly factor BamB family protein [Streptomyces flavofungini]|uniref:outer membrane protein assembly factor BamB family protein n=1 Tax=Streptomyces flavofungini TaxID=68200 RepID=UPI0025B01BE8|nr:PQQ-binding-like beta-propeller repeat protein [Streptomyces flavofungini]WJV47346.1 PQQ-binding-like beta-propeller repeat protein [Streptomyces flavofungini]
MVSHESESGRPPAHQPVPGNPYAQPVPQPPAQPPIPPPPGPQPANSRKRALMVGVGALALVLVGTGVFFVTRGDGDGGEDGSRKPVAQDSRQPERDGRESAPARDGSDDDGGKGTGEAGQIDVNAGRGPGDAKAWLAVNDVKLPGKGGQLLDLWRADGLVAQAEYDEVTAFKAADGTRAWRVRLPGEVCDTPVNPSPDGKVVVAYTTSEARVGAKCNQLQMIDLKTGKKGWHKSLTEHSTLDSTTATHVAISGSTVMVDQDSVAHAYRVRDGKRLFTTKHQREGACFLKGVAGGSALLQVQSCAAGSKSTHGRVRGLDPRTGKVEWVYRSRKGWPVEKVYSVDPLVVTLRSRDDPDKWAVAAVDERGEERSWIDLDGRKEKFDHCTGAGDSGEGVQNCVGAVVAHDTLYLASRPKDTLGPNRIVAFALGTGKAKWSARAGGRQLLPVTDSERDGPGVIVYARPYREMTGRTLFLPADGGKPKVLLKHTAAAQKIEVFMFAGNTLYFDGRLFITPTRLNGRSHGSAGEEGNGRMLSFGP